MAGRTTINDFQTAMERIDQLLEQYEGTHQGAKSWTKISLIAHANHGRIHAQQAEMDMSKIQYLSLDVVEENLASNACRALMLLERFLQLKAEKGGQVGGKIKIDD